MSRQIHSLMLADLSAFAKNLRDQIGGQDGVPGHVEMLNMISRAAGFAIISISRP